MSNTFEDPSNSENQSNNKHSNEKVFEEKQPPNLDDFQKNESIKNGR